MNDNYPEIKKSLRLAERASGLIPALTQTLAKGPTQWVDGVAPKYLVKGKGARVWDADGNEFIDYNMGIGPIVLGYGFEHVNEAIKRQLEDGITFSLMHPLEVKVSEKISSMIPNAESVRFSKTGCDVTTAAIRLARAYTKRNKVLCCGYHGWHDWYISVTDRSAGIPETTKELTHTFNYNDIDSFVNSLDADTACVIMEPAIFEKPENDFLNRVLEETHKNGSLLIFDEMWTGFRFAPGGAQEYFNVVPDLAVYSKAVANGMPLSVLTGKEEIMRLLEKEVFFFTTFGGETLSLAAALATMEIISNENIIPRLFEKGKILKDAYNEIAQSLGMDYTKCTGYDVRTIVTFNPEAANPLEMKSLVQQEMIKRGILWGGFHNMCYSHTAEELIHTIKAYEEVLPILKRAVDENNILKYLRGKPVEPVFRKTTNFKEAVK
ncbi:MAG: aminotransferase class III-fold pyridoxal phosphate-dependent enzyme [Ignavibacteria bacterium]|nr:aminotransferase class III-fold pyridoxal phosphate-dependent enzyme [Ignavibacteria bacterium]